MTSYFDAWDARLQALEVAHPTVWTSGEAVAEHEAKLIYDTTVASECLGFPSDLRAAINEAVCAHAVSCRPINDATHPRVETPFDHYRALKQLSYALHSIFHELSGRNLDGFSDSPLAPLRVLWARSEERREQMVATKKASP